MKILLIEDRIVRKELFLDRSQIDLVNYTFLREITPEEFIQLKSNIKNSDKTFFDEYDLIITHKSAFTLNEQDILASVGKSIIYFSGGISQSFYLEYPIPCLHINSSEFYSTNLVEFLNYINETGEIEMLILQFGPKWKLNLLLNTRDKLKQLLYKKVGNDLYPEDFDGIFSNKLLSTVVSNQLKDGISQLQNIGLMWSEVKNVELILTEINAEILSQINKTL
jgi:hypothetical protein